MIDVDANVVHVGDAAAQTRHVLNIIKSMVGTAGGTMDDVTFNSIFLTDWANYAAINKVYAEFFPGDKPARYCIQCGLVKPEALVEIASIAHVKKQAVTCGSQGLTCRKPESLVHGGRLAGLSVSATDLMIGPDRRSVAAEAFQVKCTD